MPRRLCLLLGVLAGLFAAVLVGWSPTAHYQGESASCAAVIAAAALPLPADGATGSDAAVRQHLSDSCHDKRVRDTTLAGLGAVLCVAFGSVVVFGGRPDRPASTRGAVAAPTASG